MNAEQDRKILRIYNFCFYLVGFYPDISSPRMIPLTEKHNVMTNWNSLELAILKDCQHTEANALQFST